MNARVTLPALFALGIQVASGFQTWSSCGWRPLAPSTAPSLSLESLPARHALIEKSATAQSLLSGVLKDAWTELPVEGVDVYVDNYFFMSTGEDGSYSVPGRNICRITFSDPARRYHDCYRYLDFSAAENLNIELIPFRVDMGLMKVLSDPCFFPMLRRWVLPIKVYLNEAASVLRFGSTEGSDSVRAAMGEWERVTALHLFEESAAPLNGLDAAHVGINLSYDQSENLGDYSHSLDPTDGSPVLGRLNLNVPSSRVTLHELGHALGLAHTGSRGFVMYAGAGPRITDNPYPDARLEIDILKTFYSMPRMADLSGYAPYTTTFSTPGSGVRWSLSDLVVASHGAIVGEYPNYEARAPIQLADRDTLEFAAGTALTVAPSCEYMGMQPLLNACWEIHGTLLLSGTSEKPIRVCSPSRYRGCWNWLNVQSNGEIIASYTIFAAANRFILSDVDQSRLKLAHCLFHDYGGDPAYNSVSPAIWISTYSSHANPDFSTEIVNCTFDPSETAARISGSIIVNGPRVTKLMNNIFLNTTYGITLDRTATGLAHSYNIFHGVQVGYSTGSIDPTERLENPQFATGTEKTSYRLSSTSPAVDSGCPDPAYNDADGSRSDIGYSATDHRGEARVFLLKDSLEFRSRANVQTYDTLTLVNAGTAPFRLLGMDSLSQCLAYLGQSGSGEVGDTLRMLFGCRPCDYCQRTSDFVVRTSYADFPVRGLIRPHGSSGPVLLDTVQGLPDFTQENSPVIVPCGRHILLNRPLTLRPGAVLLLGEGAELELAGGIHAAGTGMNPVTIGQLNSCCPVQSRPRITILGGTCDFSRAVLTDITIDCNTGVASGLLDSSDFHRVDFLTMQAVGRIQLKACNVDSASNFCLRGTACPGSFMLIRPSEDGMLDSGIVSFAWTRSPVGESCGRIGYVLRIDSVAPTFASPAVWQGSDTVASIQLPSHHRWFWTVAAIDSLGNARQTRIASFATGVQSAPRQVALVSPLDSTRVAADSVIFKWQSGGGEESSYCLEISDSQDFLAARRDIEVEGTSTVVRGVKGCQALWWRVRAKNALGWGDFSSSRRVFVESPLAVGVWEVPAEFALHQNHPNPFNAATTIRFVLPVPSYATLKVYGILGQEITTLVSGQMTAGEHEVRWSAPVSSGVYFYRLQAMSLRGGKISLATRKMLVIR